MSTVKHLDIVKKDEPDDVKEINVYPVINQESWPVALSQEEAHDRNSKVKSCTCQFVLAIF